MSIKKDIIRRCRVCGCTDNHACEGGCYWVEFDLCSACADTSEEGYSLVSIYRFNAEMKYRATMSEQIPIIAQQLTQLNTTLHQHLELLHGSVSSVKSET